jgi:hypothetical protein
MRESAEQKGRARGGKPAMDTGRGDAEEMALIIDVAIADVEVEDADNGAEGRPSGRRDDRELGRRRGAKANRSAAGGDVWLQAW